jgi:hypothetical protein
MRLLVLVLAALTRLQLDEIWLELLLTEEVKLAIR